MDSKMYWKMSLMRKNKMNKQIWNEALNEKAPQMKGNKDSQALMNMARRCEKLAGKYPKKYATKLKKAASVLRSVNLPRPDTVLGGYFN